jgi:hypothetical protein
MMDRLDDLAHDGSPMISRSPDAQDHHRRGEMQRTLSWRIDAKANGAFVVTREDEVADQKRTDIRLSAVKGTRRPFAEVKIADSRWTLTDLDARASQPARWAISTARNVQGWLPAADL